MLPKKYAFLAQTPLVPALVRTALSELGTLEAPGKPNNPTIIKWADEVAAATATTYDKWAADWYNADSIPWCGLFSAVSVVRSSPAGSPRVPPKNYLSALSWASWGVPVQWKGREGLRLGEIWVGDILVFVRKGGGHVGICVGVSENGKTVHVLGGNQGDSVNITEISIDRLYAVRRPQYINRPEGARHVRLSSSGLVSTDEA